jgi:hypothetical protein
MTTPQAVFDEFAEFVLDHNKGQWVPWPIAELFVRKYRAASPSPEPVSGEATHPMRAGLTSSFLGSSDLDHKLVIHYATRKQADAAQAWLAEEGPGEHVVNVTTGEEAGKPVEATPQALNAMNDALCSFSNRWRLDGDYIRCRICRRPQITNYRHSAFPHAEGCRAAARVEPHPWLTLLELLRPLYATASPAPSPEEGKREPLTDKSAWLARAKADGFCGCENCWRRYLASSTGRSPATPEGGAE